MQSTREIEMVLLSSNNYPFILTQPIFMHFGMICNLYFVVGGLYFIFNNLIYHRLFILYGFWKNSKFRHPRKIAQKLVYLSILMKILDIVSE